MSSIGRVTLLGGTGFVGRALATRLAQVGLKGTVVARHAESAARFPAGVKLLAGDVRNPLAMRRVLSGSDAAVYLPGRVNGHKRRQFHEIHAVAAKNCAEVAAECGLSRFIYLSALGVALDAPAWSDQTKAEGERLVGQVFPDAIVVRPSLVLGPGDHFSSEMLRLMRGLPMIPVIGPQTRVQPVHVDDLAEALGRLIQGTHLPGPVIQAAGPKVWRMAALLSALREQAKLRCRLLALPDRLAMALASVVGMVPNAPLCRDQVRLMRTDKIADPELPDLHALNIQVRDPLDQRMHPVGSDRPG